jgi:3-isopropylmalate/(R)-2-methylmalate dehydratase large subunit
MERAERPKDSETIRIEGRALYLTKDPSLIRAQIEGETLTNVAPENLRDFVSTDEIAPSGICMMSSDPEILGKHLLTGITDLGIDEKTGGPGLGVIKPGELEGKFSVLVVGRSFGRGSSREHAQLALQGAGIQAVVAGSTERIFSENCRNYGILTIGRESSEAQRLLELGQVDTSKLFDNDLVSGKIAASGGLMPFTRSRLENGFITPEVDTQERPMTIAEKIIANHARVNGTRNGSLAVKPDDKLFVEVDKGYAYELQSDISQKVLEEVFGEDAPLNPEGFYMFEDHLALMGEDNPIAVNHRNTQREFAERNNITLYPVTEEGVEGICHTVMLEKHILPGDLVLGNDSHTCTGGAANALAIGKGASEFAAALVTRDVYVDVPETIRFNLKGRLADGVTSKDLMLHLLSRKEFKDELVGTGRVFEYGGEALDEMPFDDQIVLTNMSIEGLGFTGVIEPNKQMIGFLQKQHGLSTREIEERLVFPDEGAEYSHVFDVDLSDIERMIALDGDTQNGVPLSEARGIPVQLAYIGSCTGGKLKDLEEAAGVLEGKKIADGVRLKAQASSLSVLREARERGILQILEDSGAEIVLPGCGDCMGATEGARTSQDVVISDTNRNFPGRMGRNRVVYLGNPSVVAASAILGKIATPEEVL